MQIFSCSGIGALNPHLVQGSTVLTPKKLNQNLFAVRKAKFCSRGQETVTSKHPGPQHPVLYSFALWVDTVHGSHLWIHQLTAFMSGNKWIGFFFSLHFNFLCYLFWNTLLRWICLLRFCTFWIWVILFLWWWWIRSSIPYISYKLVVGSRGLIKFRLNSSGKDTSLVVLYALKYITSGGTWS